MTDYYNLQIINDTSWITPSLSDPRTIVIGFILFTIDLITLLGNSMVIIAVATTPRLQNVTNFYVSSLAVCDLLLGITVLPPAIWVELTQGYWPLGANACKLWLSVDILLSTASILNLCIISVDRYLAITRPLGYATRRSIALAIGMITVVWTLSAVVTVPPILGWTEHNWGDGKCSVSLHAGYRIYSALGSFFVPFSVMLFVYFNIFLVARRRRHLLAPPRGPSLRRGLRMMADPTRMRTIKRNITGADEEPNGNANNSHETGGLLPKPENIETPPPIDDDDFSSDCETHADLGNQTNITKGRSHSTPRGNPPSNSKGGGSSKKVSKLQHLVIKSGSLGHIANFSTKYANMAPTTADSRALKAKREKIAFRREHKAAKTLAGVVGCFSFCWLPFFVIYVYEGFCGCLIMSSLFSCVLWLGYANSVFNPFIYAFYNQEYAKAFKRILRSLRCWRKSRRGEYVENSVADRLANMNPIFLSPTSTNAATRRISNCHSNFATHQL